MSLSSRAADLISSRARGMVTLRRPNTLSPSPVLAAAVTSAQSALTLKGAGTARLTGRVVKGSQFTIAGITGTYTVLVDAETPVTGVLSLTFSPVVPALQSAAIGAAVTFTQPHSDASYPVLRRAGLGEDEKLIEGGKQVRILPYISSLPAPKQNDRLDGVSILQVRTVDADDGIAYYRCIIGDTPS